MNRHLQTLKLLCLIGLLPTTPALAIFDDYQPEVIVAAPFVDMHTGPGRGFPVFHVAAQGEAIRILKRRTDWFKVSLDRRISGWVHVDQLRSSLDLPAGSWVGVERQLDDYQGRRWESGVTGGDFGGASSLSAYLGFSVTANITLQAEATQILGDFSDGVMGTANIIMTPFPEWRISPFFTVGGGVIRTEPHATIVRAEDREDEIVHAGAGANVYLSDRFVLRIEYKRHTVLTSRDDNEEIDQWKAGFSVFF